MGTLGTKKTFTTIDLAHAQKQQLLNQKQAAAAAKRQARKQDPNGNYAQKRAILSKTTSKLDLAARSFVQETYSSKYGFTDNTRNVAREIFIIERLSPGSSELLGSLDRYLQQSITRDLENHQRQQEQRSFRSSKRNSGRQLAVA